MFCLYLIWLNFFANILFISIVQIFQSVNYREYGLEVVSDTVPYFPVRVTVRSSWDVLTRITGILGTVRNGERRFKETCFSHFWDMDTKWKKTFWGSGVHYMLLHSIKSNKKHEMWFMVDGKPVRFWMMEYALVTGLRCGELPGEVEEKRIIDSTGAKRLANKVLAGNKSIKAQELEDRLKDGEFNDSETFKLCLVLFLHSILMASDSTKAIDIDWVMFASNLNFFNAYPWGRVSFKRTMESLQVKNLTLKHSQWAEKKRPTTYNLFGFPWAMQVNINSFLLYFF